MMSRQNFYNDPRYGNNNGTNRQKECNEDRQGCDCGRPKGPCSDDGSYVYVCTTMSPLRLMYIAAFISSIRL